jgi:hypothetical protein
MISNYFNIINHFLIKFQYNYFIHLHKISYHYFLLQLKVNEYDEFGFLKVTLQIIL